MSGHYLQVVAMVTLVKEGESRYTLPPLENQNCLGEKTSAEGTKKEKKIVLRDCACECYCSKFTERSLSSKRAIS